MTNNIDIKRGTYIMSMDARYLYGANNPKNPCIDCKKKNKCNDSQKEECSLLQKYNYNKTFGYDARSFNRPVEEETKGKGRPKKQQFRLNRKIYGVPMPYSLAFKELYRRYENEFMVDDFGKTYTNLIINVKFKNIPKTKSEDKIEYLVEDMSNKFIDKDKAKIAEINKLNDIEDNNKSYKKTVKKKPALKADDNIKTSRDLRYNIYENGFMIDGVKYVRLMRSSSKSRGGSCLFIKEQYCNEFISWARLNLKFELIDDDTDPNKVEFVDLASLFAYESLILSSIEDTVYIDKDEILLISDYESKFKGMASVTELAEEEIDGQMVKHAVVIDKEYDFSNSLFDGSCLMDESKFNNKKGVKLLRQRMFKGAAFNAKITRFLDEQLTEEEKERGYLLDMVNRPVKIDRIKLICTPSSLKWVKFSFKYVCDYESEKFKYEIAEYKELLKSDPKSSRLKELNNIFMKPAYEYWLENLNGEFGVVKSEKGIYDDARCMSAQQLQALPLNIEECKELLKAEFDFIQKLKDDPETMLWFLGNYKSENKEFIANLLVRNKNVANTALYREFRDNIVETYKENRLRLGKIKVPNSDYAVAIANPISYLYHAIGRDISEPKEFNKYDPKLKNRECYCSAYKDGEDLFCIRNPIIFAGNVCCVKNAYNDDFKRYLNLTDNILIVNVYDNDFMDRNSGEDWDIDTNFLSNHPLLVEKAKFCEENYLTPVNFVPSKLSKKFYCIDNIVDTDSKISQGKIGEVCNSAAIINGYMWDIFYSDLDEESKNKAFKYLYNHVSRLSSVSNCEIDSAKKEFAINTKIELKKINDMDYINKVDLIVPDNSLKIKEPKNIENLSEEKLNLIEENNNKKAKCISLKEELDQFQEKLIKLESEEKENELIKEYKEKIEKLYDEIDQVLSGIVRIKEDAIVRPYFMKWCGVGKQYKFDDELNCPMDHIERILEKAFPRKTNTDNKGQSIPINKIFINPEESLDDANRRKITEIVDLVTEMDKQIREVKTKKKKKKQEEFISEQDYFNDTVQLIADMEIDPITIKCMFHRIYGNPNTNNEAAKDAVKNIRSVKTRLIEVLYLAHPEKVLAIFDYDTDYKKLEFFGNTYHKKVVFEKSAI
jgi:hypothetical protein